MQPIAYGDSYGGVAQNALALDAARDARYFQSLADNRDRQRESDNFSLGQQQLDQARAEAYARQMQGHENDALAQQQLQQQAHEADLNRQNELALTQLRISPYENKVDARTKLGVYQQVWQGINNGTIRTPGDLDASAAGVLDPGDMARLAVALDGAHSKMMTAFQGQQGNANRFNTDFAAQVGSYYPAYAHASALASAAPIAADLPSFMGFHRPVFLGGQASRESLQNDAAIGRYTSALGNFEAGLAKNRVAQSLQYDPSNALHPFAPSMEAPAQWGSSGASSEAPALPVAPHAAAWQPLTAWGVELHPDAARRIQAAVAAAGSNDADQKAVLRQQLKMAEAAHQSRPLPTTATALGLPTTPTIQPSTPLVPGDTLPEMDSSWGQSTAASDDALPATW